MNLFEEKDGNHLSRMQSFIIFEPASIRVNDEDILLMGDEIMPFYEEFMEKLEDSNSGLQDQILANRLSKIGHMLDLIQNFEGVIISKFFDRIWRRYSYISHLGESFVDLKTFLNYFPDYDKKDSDLIANRFDDFGDDDSDDDSDDDDDSEDTDSLDDSYDDSDDDKDE